MYFKIITPVFFLVIALNSCSANSESSTENTPKQDQDSISTKDTSIHAYITKNFKNYIRIKNNSELPQRFIDCQAQIDSFFKSRNWVLDEYYTSSEVDEDSNSFYIQFHHISGFIKDRNLQEEVAEKNKNRPEGEPEIFVFTNGNLSGKDGSLEFDKATGKIEAFRMWQ